MDEEIRGAGGKSGYWMILPLDRKEVVRRLKNATIMRGEWVSYRNKEKYLFYGKVDNNGFALRINLSHLSPGMTQNCFLPKGVYGTIKAGANGRSIVYFRVKKQKIWIFLIVAVLLLISSVTTEPLETFGIVWSLVIGAASVLGEQYGRYAERRVVEWLKELWEAEAIERVQ